ncbi:3-hydroxyisobutyrate dehydrogenase family protein [Mizugakiibacter sediminis]|uniref:3-hydroxyisobutyrate dehydrogenase family protein n=1 Tax=Mizugakiibacter sediminis TaxID=1475481 RepID=A0A0K8QR14_9GAMM|nr:NAD(P)-dependent oxidoreductase [Mizugakiibacter sediminis]GAP67320.1 3-hydroxyisobutyrate dehydrogenase family protein [Mizugakiibacter sediminis]
MKIAFIGLGNMGAPMARHLQDAGHELRAWTRSAERRAELRGAGLNVVDELAAAAAGAEAAISMLADDAAEFAVSEGDGGLLRHLPRAAVRVSMSTIGVDASRRLAGLHAAHGQGYVAAPVFGRPAAAAARALWIAAAGDDGALARVRPLLETLGRGLSLPGGPAETAHALKLGANALGAIITEGLGEVFAFGAKAGVAPAAFLELLDQAMLQAGFVGNYARMIVAGGTDSRGGFPLRLALKDVGLALDAAVGLRAPLPLAAAVRDRMLRAVATGRGGHDLPALARLAFEDAGLDGRP